MRIALLNAVVANGGDAALLLGAVWVLREAFGVDTAFTVYDASPPEAWAHYPDLDLRPPLSALAFAERPAGLRERVLRRIRWVLRRPRLYAAASRLGQGRGEAARRLTRADEHDVLRDLAAADLVVSVGGTYLVEHYRLGPRFFTFGVIRRLRRPLVLFTQSMGPFTKPGVQRAMRRVLRQAHLVLLRDAASLRHVQALGVDLSNVHVSADTAFALADPDALRRAREQAWPADRPPRVAVSVRDWPYFKRQPAAEGMRRYREAVAAAVVRLVREHGAEVSFLSTCQGVPGYPYDDAAVARRIVELLPEDVRARVTVETQYHRPEVLMERLGTHDLVLSTRMHVAILALCAGTPVLPIAYEFKTAELFERLGAGAWVQDIEAVTVEALPEVVEGFVAALPGLRGPLFERVEAERAEAMHSGERTRRAVWGAEER